MYQSSSAGVELLKGMEACMDEIWDEHLSEIIIKNNKKCSPFNGRLGGWMIKKLDNNFKIIKLL